MKTRVRLLAPGIVLLACVAMMHVACEHYYQHYVDDAQKQQEEQGGDAAPVEESSGDSSGGGGSGDSWDVKDIDRSWKLDLDNDDDNNVFAGGLSMNLDVDSDGDIDGTWTKGTIVDGKVYQNRDIKLELRDNGTGDIYKLKGKVSQDGKKMNGSWKCSTNPAPDHEGDWDAKD